MSIEIKPETELLIEEELQKGHFRSVDSIIVEGYTLGEKSMARNQSILPERRTTLSEFLLNSPVAGAELDLERDNDAGRTVLYEWVSS